MADDFTFAPTPAAEPFNLGSIATPPFVAPQTTPPTGRTPAPPSSAVDRQQMLKLALLIPLAMRRGPGAVQGLLAGFAQHAQQQYQQGRQTAADQRAQEQADWTRQYQQGQLDQQTQQRRQALLTDFATKIQGLDDPTAVDALTKLYTTQATNLGMAPEAFTSYAQTYANPTTLQQKAAKKKIADLKSEYGADKWMDVGAQFTHQLPGMAQPVTFDQLLSLAGMARDPNAPQATPKDKRGFQPRDVVVNGQRMPANYDPDTGLYYAIGNNNAPLTGDIQEYVKPTTGPRDRFSVQPITNPDGSTGLIRVNLDTGEVSQVALPSGTGAGKPSDTEKLSKAYLDRTTASHATATQFEQSLASLGSQLDVRLPNLLKSEAGQRYKQAKDEFINAALRRESGAAIQPSEYDRFDKIYFVTPGDTPATIRQKQAARARVIEGFRTAAGNMGRPPARPAGAPGANPFRR